MDKDERLRLIAEREEKLKRSREYWAKVSAEDLAKSIDKTLFDHTP